MRKINIQYTTTKLGEFIIGSFDGKLCLLDFRYRKMRKTIDGRIKKGVRADFVEQSDSVIVNAKKQIDEYLLGERVEFDIPLLMVGTDFQKMVWNALLQIPYGKTCTYQQLAERIRKPESIRAVGSANGANSISIIVPCHRIIGHKGDLVGYAGGLNVKKRLLRLEQSIDFLSAY